MLAFLVASGVLASGLTGIPDVQVIHPRMGKMAPASAVCFALLGAALWLVAAPAVSRTSRASAMLAASAALVLASASIAGLFRSMPLFSGLSFILLALSLLLLDRKDALAQVLTSAVACIALFALLAYGYGALSIVSAPATRALAFHSLILFVLLSAGIAFARPGRGFVGLALESSPGGRLIRVMVPVSILVPGVLGWIMLEGERAGRYPSLLALAIFATATTILFALLSWWTGWWIDRMEQRRRRAEEALRTLEEQSRAGQKLESLGRLAGGIAHDFNNMLTVIYGYCELLLLDLPEEGSRREKVKLMKAAAERAARLTHQLLAFSRRQPIQPQPVDLNGSVSGVEKMLERVLGEDVKIVVRLDPELRKIYADPGQIEQVLMNLAVNARDAMPTGGVLVLETGNIEIEQAFARAHVGTVLGRNVMLAVSDTGTGMTPETQARIFEPFFTTKAVGKGTGLGLASVYGIVKQLGGHIWVHSKVGKGTTFKVSFPAHEVEAERPAEPRPEPVDLRGTETVMIVDDDREIRELAARILERNGYRALRASGAAEARRQCAAHTEGIDLLVTDVVMPETNGPELAAQLAAQYPELRVLYTSGYTADAMERIGLVENPIAFLQKPYTPDGLLKAIRRELANPVAGG